MLQKETFVGRNFTEGCRELCSHRPTELHLWSVISRVVVSKRRTDSSLGTSDSSAKPIGRQFRLIDNVERLIRAINALTAQVRTLEMIKLLRAIVNRKGVAAMNI